MREDIKRKKYKKQYKEVEQIYCNEYLNVKECCTRVGITPSTYYKICKTLGKRSVGTPKPAPKPTKTVRKSGKVQRGGSITHEVPKDWHRTDTQWHEMTTEGLERELEEMDSYDQVYGARQKIEGNYNESNTNEVLSGTVDEITTKLRQTLPSRRQKRTG